MKVKMVQAWGSSAEECSFHQSNRAGPHSSSCATLCQKCWFNRII